MSGMRLPPLTYTLALIAGERLLTDPLAGKARVVDISQQISPNTRVVKLTADFCRNHVLGPLNEGINVALKLGENDKVDPNISLDNSSACLIRANTVTKVDFFIEEHGNFKYLLMYPDMTPTAVCA